MEHLIWKCCRRKPFVLSKKVLAGSSFSGSVLLDQCWWINIAGLLFNNISALRENLSPFTSEYHYLSVWESCSPGSGSSTVESLANAHKPQRCGVFLSNFIYFYVACVACLWYNGLEVMTLETIF